MPSISPRLVAIDQSLFSLPILEVSPLVETMMMKIDKPVDTKTNIQTFVSPEEVASWLQRKKEGMTNPSH